jgi:ubiquinone/menaquinone biosynthesis C-methylase UbiE
MAGLRRKRNPWLDIPAGDYEGHMSHDSVGQLQALNRIFAEIVVTFEPRHLAVIGCATGNGFEHIRPEVTESVIAVDINADYLAILEERYRAGLPGLRVVCEDVAKVRIDPDSLDHVHAGLIFEYVDVKPLLKRVAAWLKTGGVLSVVLQMPSPDSTPVTETSYDSLKLLEPVMQLVDPVEVGAEASNVGLSERKSFDVELKQGKKFRVIYFVRIHA